MSTFIRLTDFKSSEEKEREFFNIKNRFDSVKKENLLKIPGYPLAYWASDRIIEVFSEGKKFGDFAISEGQNITGDNERFFRFFWEVSKKNVGKNKKWVLTAKGGSFRRWYGNIIDVMDWSDSARTYYKNAEIARIQAEHLWFRKGITWNLVGNSTGFRLIFEDNLFNKAAPTLLFNNDDEHLINYILALFNSKITFELLKVLNPTINTNIADLLNIPFINQHFEQIDSLAQRIISISKSDWESKELSSEFVSCTLLNNKYHNQYIQESYNILRADWQNQTFIMQKLEEENNHLFIEIYGLQKEITPEVPISEISLYCNPCYRYNENKNVNDRESLLLTDTIKELISYAVGCMFGRYSPHKEGMILANKGESIEDFKKLIPHATFIPDDDNIIPILDNEYFTDDIVTRFKEFLKVTFGEESLAKNLEFIAGALSPNGSNSPEKTIRNYFLKSFYKDHVQMYNKRPIYWLFTSGENQAFNALIYMHRYEKSTLSKMRTDYLLELESKLDASLNMLSSDPVKNKTKITNLRKQIDELKEYDALLNNKALALIDFDLDDGIVVNYKKFDGLVKPI